MPEDTPLVAKDGKWLVNEGGFSPVKKATSMQEIPSKRFGVLTEEEKRKVEKRGSGIIVDHESAVLVEVQQVLQNKPEQRKAIQSNNKGSDKSSHDKSVLAGEDLSIFVKDAISSSQKETTPESPTEVSDEWALLIQESIKEAREELSMNQNNFVGVNQDDVSRRIDTSMEVEKVIKSLSPKTTNKKIENINEVKDKVSRNVMPIKDKMPTKDKVIVEKTTAEDLETKESEEMPKEIIKHMIDVQTNEVEKIGRMKLSILQELKEKEALLKKMEQEELNLKKSLEQLPTLQQSTFSKGQRGSVSENNLESFSSDIQIISRKEEKTSSQVDVKSVDEAKNAGSQRQSIIDVNDRESPVLQKPSQPIQLDKISTPRAPRTTKIDETAGKVQPQDVSSTIISSNLDASAISSKAKPDNDTFSVSRRIASDVTAKPEQKQVSDSKSMASTEIATDNKSLVKNVSKETAKDEFKESPIQAHVTSAQQEPNQKEKLIQQESSLKEKKSTIVRGKASGSTSVTRETIVINTDAITVQSDGTNKGTEEQTASTSSSTTTTTKSLVSNNGDSVEITMQGKAAKNITHPEIKQRAADSSSKQVETISTKTSHLETQSKELSSNQKELIPADMGNTKSQLTNITDAPKNLDETEIRQAQKQAPPKQDQTIPAKTAKHELERQSEAMIASQRKESSIAKVQTTVKKEESTTAKAEDIKALETIEYEAISSKISKATKMQDILAFDDEMKLPQTTMTMVVASSDQFPEAKDAQLTAKTVLEDEEEEEMQSLQILNPFMIGQSARLLGEVPESDPRAKTTWFKDKQQISLPSRRFLTILKGNTRQFIIHNVQEEDMGYYEMRVNGKPLASVFLGEISFRF